MEDVLRPAEYVVCESEGARAPYGLDWDLLGARGCGLWGWRDVADRVLERLNSIVNQARLQYEELITGPEGGVLIAGKGQLSDFTPQDLQTALEHVRNIEAEVDEATAAIDPPAAVAHLHRLFFDFDSEFIAAQEALAARAGTAVDWAELSETPEMSAYRTALAKDKQDCADSQAEVNAIGERREAFSETPWIPGELKEVFEVALGCDGYPEHPEDLYRPPPSPNP